MLSYFRINDPYRLVVIFAFLVLVRLAIFLGGFPEHISELKWMVLGEKLSGEAVLYVDLWDNFPPLSAAVYRVIDSIFDRSPITNHILSLFLVFIQSIIFNNLFLKHRAYNENTYLPAFLYVVFMNLFFDFYLLSPVLMGLTFILLALDNIITHLGDSRNDQLVLYTGLYLGAANLFYYPAFMIVIAVYVAYTFLTATGIRRYLLLTFGYCLPLIITWIYYYLQGGMKEFYIDFVFSIFNVTSQNYLDAVFYLFILAIPFGFTVVAITKTFRSPRFNNQQERIQKLMLILLFFSAFIWFLNKERAPFQLIVIVPPMAFFLTHYFLNLKVKWKAEILFASFLAGILFVNISTYQKTDFVTKYFNYENLEVGSTKWDDLVRDKKILYLGEDYSIYRNASLATPYFNWDLSKLHLNYSQYFDNLTDIYNNFKKELPEVIIDEKGVMIEIMDKMPTIREAYQSRQNGQVYIRRNGLAQ